MERCITTPFSRRALLMSALATGANVAPGFDRLGQAARVTPAPQSSHDQLFEDLGVFVVQRMAELRIPGVAIGVIADGTEYAAGFGITNVDHPLPVDPQTRFQIGSTTKSFTGTALMRLVEQGKLDLESPVRTYLPDFRVANREVSEVVQLRDLVTHTAGWYDPPVLQETGDGDDALATFVAGLADRRQIAPPGKYFSYNNGAVCLAGRVIEAVTGQTYESAVKELVLDPLGMEQTSFFPEEFLTEAFAVGHDVPPDDPGGEPIVLEPWALPRAANPAGGLASSLADALRYARFHLGEGMAQGVPVLSAEGMRRMQTPLGPGGTTPGMGEIRLDAVGVTWMLWQRDGVQIVSHPGGTNGQQSTFSLVPERGFAVTVLTNAQVGLLLGFEVTNWVLEHFLGLETPLLKTAPVDPARPDEYAGEYALPDGSDRIRVRQTDSHLLLVTASPVLVPGQETIELPGRIVGDDTAAIEYRGISFLADFVRDTTEHVAWIRFLGRLIPRSA